MLPLVSPTGGSQHALRALRLRSAPLRRVPARLVHGHGERGKRLQFLLELEGIAPAVTTLLAGQIWLDQCLLDSLQHLLVHLKIFKGV